jgi:hypothetical protein
MWLYLSTTTVRRTATVIFGLVMVGIQAYVLFGPPPVSDQAAAGTAFASYAVFAVIIGLLERRPRVPLPAA